MSIIFFIFFIFINVFTIEVSKIVCCWFIMIIINWVQRGHQNSLEMMPVFFMLMILGGLRHPCTCGVLGALYTVTRFFYFKGYSTGDPQNRLTIGKYGFLALLGLMVSTISFGVSLLLSWSYFYKFTTRAQRQRQRQRWRLSLCIVNTLWLLCLRLVLYVEIIKGLFVAFYCV